MINYLVSINKQGESSVSYADEEGDLVVVYEHEVGYADVLADLHAGRQPQPIEDYYLSDEEVLEQVVTDLSDRVSIDNGAGSAVIASSHAFMVSRLACSGVKVEAIQITLLSERPLARSSRARTTKSRWRSWMSPRWSR